MELFLVGLGMRTHVARETACRPPTREQAAPLDVLLDLLELRKRVEDLALVPYVWLASASVNALLRAWRLINGEAAACEEFFHRAWRFGK